MTPRAAYTALPLLSALAYYVSSAVLVIRMASGENAISNKAVCNCLVASTTPLIIATTISGVDVVKQLCSKGYQEAKKSFFQSINPEGLIGRVLFPAREMTFIGQSMEEMECAHAHAYAYW